MGLHPLFIYVLIIKLLLLFFIILRACYQVFLEIVYNKHILINNSYSLVSIKELFFMFLITFLTSKINKGILFLRVYFGEKHVS